MGEALSARILGLVAGADPATLRTLLRRALGTRKLALCFHRTGSARRDGELFPKLTSPAAEIDALLELLLRSVDRHDPWLTVAFDDGYREAAEYVLDRAPRFPRVEWLFFVCPQKTERGAGYRWDLAEVRRRADSRFDVEAALDGPVDLASENLRPDLLEVAARDEFALADVEACRRIQRLPNAALGNHSNAHRRPALLSPDEFRGEMEGSLRDFERLFGPARHFAFPFGVPGEDFGPGHVAALRALGRFEIWSTEPRPYRQAERDRGGVLPRFAVDGTRTAAMSAAHVALHALRPASARGRYPPPEARP